MSSVAELETAIQQLSIAEQRLIAAHLDERLAGRAGPVERPATDEGIRHLPPFGASPTPRERRARASRRPAAPAR